MRLLVLFLAAIPAFAATIGGRIVDSTGAPLPGVTVAAASVIAISNEHGEYTLDVAPGTHELSFRLAGFATVVRTNVAAGSRANVTLLVAMNAGMTVNATQTLGSSSAGVVPSNELQRRPFRRAGEVLETVPGVIVSQHSGEGKANQYYLRGFNLDHGTDIAISVAGTPVNMPTHAHGQGYADANFLIPELIGAVQYRKGPYHAEDGDFASAGAVTIDYLEQLERPVAIAQGGSFGFGRVLLAASPRIGNGHLLFALEGTRNGGPWEQPDDYRRANALLRFSSDTLTITAMSYDARWSATDQIPLRAVRSGALSRFGNVDSTNGGMTSRHSLSAEWDRGKTRVAAYAMQYRLDLFSNFTYFLDDPVNGDQFEQKDDRLVFGGEASHRWIRGRGENVVALQLRRDDIDDVGLHRTLARRRISTVRQEDVLQTSIGAYAQNAMRWSPRVRTIAGLRIDRDRTTIASPKLSVILGPWRNSELYLNAGSGFHSNDARSAEVTPLVRTRGAEAGVRSTVVPRLQATATLWALNIDSELVFIGDAGTTEAGQPSRRRGAEVTASYEVRPWLAIDAQYAYSRGRFENGDRIPGAVEGVAAAGLSLIDLGSWNAEVRYRWFGPRPLLEDNSVRSNGSGLLSARARYAFTPRVRLDVDVFNLLDAEVSDVDYFYTSRLREESVAVDDVHFHPVEKRSVRVGLSTTF